MEMIRIADMLATMNNRQPFEIVWVTCDEKKNTGGEKIHLKQAVIVGTGNSKGVLRNPDHYENYTRNIRALEGDRPIKIHIPLITRFNGKRVIL